MKTVGAPMIYDIEYKNIDVRKLEIRKVKIRNNCLGEATRTKKQSSHAIIIYQSSHANIIYQSSHANIIYREFWKLSQTLIPCSQATLFPQIFLIL